MPDKESSHTGYANEAYPVSAAAAYAAGPTAGAYQHSLTTCGIPALHTLHTHQCKESAYPPEGSTIYPTAYSAISCSTVKKDKYNFL